MSLINDALKKAQKHRAEETAPPSAAAGGGPPAQIVRRDRPMAVQNVLLLIGGAVVLVVLAAGVTAYVLRSGRKPALALRSNAALVNPPRLAGTPDGLPKITLPALTEPPRPTAKKIAEAPVHPHAVAPAAAPVQPPAPTTPDPRALAFIDALKITGILASGTDSKVLMNDHVFRVNDIVSYEFGLRLKAVNSDSLTFVDGHGFVYTKNF